MLIISRNIVQKFVHKGILENKPFRCLVNTVSGSLTGKIDRHKGIHVRLNNNFIEFENNFANQLENSLLQWKQQNLAAVWLYLNIQQGALIATASQYGFLFHHAEGNEAVLNLWIRNGQSRLPHYATHQLGVAGCVVDEENKRILLIQEKVQKFPMWKFPGGLSDLGEDIQKTAEREVYEETGIQAESLGIIAIREQHLRPDAFGRSDFYFICLMKPLTFDIRPCALEVDQCEWQGLEETFKSEQASPLTKRLLNLIKVGMLEGWNSILLPSFDIPTLFGTKANVYHRMVDIPETVNK